MLSRWSFILIFTNFIVSCWLFLIVSSWRPNYRTTFCEGKGGLGVRLRTTWGASSDNCHLSKLSPPGLKVQATLHIPPLIQTCSLSIEADYYVLLIPAIALLSPLKTSKFNSKQMFSIISFNRPFWDRMSFFRFKFVLFPNFTISKLFYFQFCALSFWKKWFPNKSVQSFSLLYL